MYIKWITTRNPEKTNIEGCTAINRGYFWMNINTQSFQSKDFKTISYEGIDIIVFFVNNSLAMEKLIQNLTNSDGIIKNYCQ